ncbi:S1C family serine protease [Sphingomonas sp. Root710]|uniref:S1C family serine protease n=1 Tax=Sphingomonas sp. Root710 TaxID=1736594 RepID=UPI0009E686BA|nr:S1C family serine protease [Sphingomonas sp. Root710]
MSRYLRCFVAAALAVAAAPALAQWTPAPGGAMVVGAQGLQPDPATKMRPLKLARLVVKMKRGETFGQYRTGLLCMFPKDIVWSRGGKWDFDIEEFDDVFREEMAQAGFAIAGNPSNLFEDESDSRPEYLIGGTVSQMRMDVCYPTSGIGAFGSVKSKATIDVEWQVYSEIERKVIGTVKTSGNAEAADGRRRGEFSAVLDAFAVAVRKLADNQRLRAALTGPMTDRNVARAAPQGLTPLSIRTSVIAPASVADAVGSAVLIFAGGHGSGFLISPDGYVLTNYHVAGGGQYVKVRWADGTESLGEVIRGDKARDVALIKTDAKGREPLRLRQQPVKIGEDIYAIGAPLDKNLQNTVTKGIVSATRVIDGLNYFQGDVGVTFGNSGGPIIDSKGQVVGMTVSGRVDTPMVNFFIPIAEAQSFLGLQLQPPK